MPPRATRRLEEAATKVPLTKTRRRAAKAEPDPPVLSEETSKPPPKRRKIKDPLPSPSDTAPLTRPTIPIQPFSLSHAQTHLKSHDPRFGTIFTHLPCKPFEPPYPAIDPFRTLVTSIIGQQVSWLAAKAINKRFKELFGFQDDGEAEEGGGFPTPKMVVEEDLLRMKSVGLSLRKAEYVKSLAEHFESGLLSDELLRDGSDEEIARALIAVRGIGQWTVDMFLMFSLRRPDVLPVGDLGVQKGLIRWILAAHDALPISNKPKGKANAQAREKYGLDKNKTEDKVDIKGQGEIITALNGNERAVTPPRKNNGLPPTPVSLGVDTPHIATLHTPDMSANDQRLNVLPPTPLSPGPSIKPEQTLIVGQRQLPRPAPEEMLKAMTEHGDWDVERIAPLGEGMSLELLKSRLSGKKAKGGAYLTPKEMEVLTDGWRPYRSLGVYYMWPAGEDF